MFPRIRSFRPTRFARWSAHASLLVLLAGFTASIAQAQTRDDRSFVLLNNGSVFHGVARSVGERLEIQLGEGSSIQVDKKQVAFVASSKLELYEKQVRSTRRWGASEHAYLTQWCIQQGLIDQAMLHFGNLAKITPHDGTFKQLEHKLKQAIINSERVKAMLAQNAPDNAAIPAAPAANPPELAAHSDAPSDVVLASAAHHKIEPTDEERIVLNAIPGYVRKTFQTSIAPILVSRCGQAGCHGVPGNSVFRVRQAVGEQAGLVMAENIENVLRYSNLQDPLESELIAYATKAHGTQSQPRFSPHIRDEDLRHIQRITQWIKSVSLTTSTTTQNPAIPNASVPQRSPNQQFAGTSGDEVIRAVAVQDANTPVIAIATSVTTGEQESRMDRIQEWLENAPEQDKNAKLSKPAKASQGPAVISNDELVQLEKFIERLDKQHSQGKQKDPFDPNYFNTRYR